MGWDNMGRVGWGEKGGMVREGNMICINEWEKIN